MLDGLMLTRYLVYPLFFAIIPAILFSNPLIIAHRGGARLSPENTNIAFQKSINANVSFIEFDVQLSKDKVPVIFHDDDLSRLTDGMIDDPVTRLKVSDLKAIDIGSWFSSKYHAERIVTLEEAFETIPPNVGMMIELKDCKVDHTTFVQQVNKVLKKFKGSHNKVVVGSLEPRIVRELQKGDIPFPVLGIVDTLPDAIEFQMLNLKHLAVNVDLFKNPAFVSMIKDKDYLLWSWTVNHAEDVKLLSQFPIEGYITDDYLAINDMISKNK